MTVAQVPEAFLACFHALAASDTRAAVEHARRNLEARGPRADLMMAKALIAQGTQLPLALTYAERALQGTLPLETSEKIILAAFVAMENMRAGDFGNGARLLAYLNELDAVLPTPIPRWKGEPLKGKCVLMACGSPLLERNGQVGYGDEILWARFAPLLASIGARVYLRCHPRLARLFESLEGVTITTSAEIAERPYCLVNAMTVPGGLGLRREQMAGAPYLCAEPLELAGDAFKIGLSWGCSPVGPQNRYCSLAELSALAEIPGVQLYSLDKTHHAEQLRPAPAGMNVIDLAPRFEDFADTAAAVMAMDAVVSTDNVIANLAGALGKPLYLLHSHIQPEYRWGQGERTPWYPSARVFRQPKPGDWRGAVSMAAGEIQRQMRKRALLRMAA